MLCQEQVAQLRDVVPRIHDAGAELVIVGNGTRDHAAWFREELRLTTPLFTDPSLEAYRAAGARRIGSRALLTPRTYLNYLRAWRGGFRGRGLRGDARQVGGVFVVLPDGRVPYAYRSQLAGDHPDPAEVIEALERAVGEGAG